MSTVTDTADRSVTVARPEMLRVRRGGGWSLVLVSLVGAVAFAWPFVRSPEASTLAHQSDAPWFLLAVIPLLLLVLLGDLTSGRLDAKAIAVMAILAAAGTALRMPTGGIAGLEMVFFLLIPAGRVFGRGFGFVLGALTLFASAVFTAGVGPWLPFQMLAAGWIGLGAACLPPAKGRAEIALLSAYAVVAAYAYGLALDAWFWPFGTAAGTELGPQSGASVVTNLGRFVLFHATTSMGWDTMRAVTTMAMLLALGPAVLAALRRAARRAYFPTAR